MNNTEKIAFLNNVIFELQKSIYTMCVQSGINPETLDIDTHNPEAFIYLFPENMHHKQHVACVTINRNMAYLAAAITKLNGLNNV